MTININPSGLMAVTTTGPLPDRAVILRAAGEADPTPTVETIATERFHAANPTADLRAEREALQAKIAYEEDKLRRAEAERNTYGLYWVQMRAPFAGSMLSLVVSILVAAVLYLIDVGALVYTQTIYVAQSAFFDRIADDFWATVPYALVVILGAPGLFALGMSQRNNVRQERFARRVLVFGIVALGLFFVMLAIMGSGLLGPRSPLVGWVAFGLIFGHTAASLLLGAGIGLSLKLSRQETGTQHVVVGEGFRHGDALMANGHEERLRFLGRIGEIDRTLEVIGHAHEACLAAWRAELADILAELGFAAAAGRETHRRALLANASTLPPSLPLTDAPAPAGALN